VAARDAVRLANGRKDRLAGHGKILQCGEPILTIRAAAHL